MTRKTSKNRARMKMEWKTTNQPIQYNDALEFMEQRVGDIHDGVAPECVWLLEHPHLYTAGTSANDTDLLRHDLPVFQTGRGGQYTYHGPGQRVGYAMLNLRQRQAAPDIKHYVWQLEEWIIRTLARLNVKGERREGRVGIWVDMQPYGFQTGHEAKIAAIGVRIRRWVSFHGIAINLNPDLSMFDGIVPCGIVQHGVTSLEQLGVHVTMNALDDILKQEFLGVFHNDDTTSCESLVAQRA